MKFGNNKVSPSLGSFLRCAGCGSSPAPDVRWMNYLSEEPQGYPALANTEDLSYLQPRSLSHEVARRKGNFKKEEITCPCNHVIFISDSCRHLPGLPSNSLKESACWKIRPSSLLSRWGIIETPSSLSLIQRLAFFFQKECGSFLAEKGQDPSLATLLTGGTALSHCV